MAASFVAEELFFMVIREIEGAGSRGDALAACLENARLRVHWLYFTIKNSFFKEKRKKVLKFLKEMVKIEGKKHTKFSMYTSPIKKRG